MFSHPSSRCWMARLATVVVSVALIAAACGDDDSDDAAPATTVEASDTVAATTTAPATTTPPTTAAAAETLRILVSNDDGVDAEGISLVVAALAELPDTEVTVSAPVENQSGTSDTMTEGELATEETTTADGHPATAVDGTPADSVAAGLESMTEPPHLVISGINEGPNIVQASVDRSGTIGAARTAARAGIPALATSQWLGDPPDFPTGVEVVLTWVEEHRDALLAGDIEATVISFNFPTCPTGEPRGEVVEVPPAAEIGDRDLGVIDCEGEPPVPEDDVDALIFGFTSESELTF